MTTSTLSQAALDRLHEAMAARVARRELPGMVLLIARGDDVHVDCIGATAFEDGEPMRRDTIFRVASVTKPLLAATTLMLVEDGTLGLAEPVERWLPELADRRVLRHVDGPLDDTVPATRPMTVEDLLTMRMGYGLLLEPTFDPPVPVSARAQDLQLVLGQPDPRTPHAPDAWLARFASLPLMYQPGEYWQYNASFLVLGVLVARAAGAPLGDVMQTRLCRPLELRTTDFWLPAVQSRRLPTYYMTNFETGKLEVQPVSSAEEWSRPAIFPSGAGGLLSTADDLLAFGQLMLGKGEYRGRRLLSADSVARMTTNHLSPAEIAFGGMLLGGRGWGYGVGVVTEPDAAWPVPGRYGWSGGYGTAWFNDPHREIVAVVLTQTSDFLWSGALDEFDRLVGQV